MTPKKTKELFADITRKLVKALGHLDYSFKKIQKLPTDPKKLDDETLETWESFSARFSRVADLYLTKYLRTAVLLKDPGFEGSFIDFLNQAEKFGMVELADDWLKLRSLRNITAHDYTEEQLEEFFKDLKAATPKLLALSKTIK